MASRVVVALRVKASPLRAFEAVGEDKTRVTVSHSGWDSVPTEHVAKHGFPDTGSWRGAATGGERCWGR